MTKLLLKSLYRRMLPMELRKFFFNWVLLRNTFCAVMREALAFEQRCTYLTDMRPLRVCPHSRGGGCGSARRPHVHSFAWPVFWSGFCRPDTAVH